MLDTQRASVKAVLKHLPSNATIQSIEAPTPLVLSGKTNPTRHQMFTNGLDRYVDDTYPGGLRGLSTWIGHQEPTIIALGGRAPRRWLAETLNSEYQRVGKAPGWAWHVHESVGPETMSALRRAVKDVTRSIAER